VCWPSGCAPPNRLRSKMRIDSHPALRLISTSISRSNLIVRRRHKLTRDTASIDEPAIEETLDPEDWGELRKLGHRMLDDMFDFLSTVRDKPAWQPVPEDVKAALNQSLPLRPADPAAVYEEFVHNVLPYTNGNRHPRFWGWVQGNGTVLGMLADMLAAGMNPHMAGFDQAPKLVEQQVLAWLIELMGMP